MEKKKIVTIFLVSLFSIGIAFGQNETDFETMMENGSVTITGYTGTRTQLVIPVEISGIPVTKIGNRAFLGKRLTSVTIPNTIIEIEREAFRQNYLTVLALPNSIKIIGDYAFFSNWLTNVAVPDSVTNIGNQAFAYQSSSFRSDGPDPYFIMIHKGEVTITFYNGRGGVVNIPEKINNLPVVAIEASSFSYKKITQITIPKTVRTIGNGAFIGNSFTEVNIPESVTSIGHSAFSNNPLRNVTVPHSVVSMGGQVFDAFDLNPTVRSELESRFGESVFVLKVMNVDGSVYRQ
jgi:hypothetical protein